MLRQHGARRDVLGRIGRARLDQLRFLDDQIRPGEGLEGLALLLGRIRRSRRTQAYQAETNGQDDQITRSHDPPPCLRPRRSIDPQRPTAECRQSFGDQRDSARKKAMVSASALSLPGGKKLSFTATVFVDGST